jgi:hypothetical protein
VVHVSETPLAHDFVLHVPFEKRPKPSSKKNTQSNSTLTNKDVYSSMSAPKIKL